MNALSLTASVALTAAAAGLLPAPPVQVVPPVQTVSQPLTQDQQAGQTDAQRQAVLYSERIAGSSGEWMERGASVTLPDGRVLAINKGGVDVLYISEVRVIVTRYGSITSLGNAQARGWLTVHPDPVT